jgi:hypothetical protein
MPDTVLETPPATPPATPPVTPPAAITPPATPPVTPPVTPPPAAPEGQEPHAPESYVLTLPEKSPLTGIDLDRFKVDAKALGLTNAQAQKYVESQHALVTEAIAQSDRELATLKADPVFGGTKFDATVKQADRGLRELGGAQYDALKTLLVDRGLGNHPVLVKALAAFGQKFKEDSPIASLSGGTPEPKTVAERLYGPDKPKA